MAHVLTAEERPQGTGRHRVFGQPTVLRLVGLGIVALIVTACGSSGSAGTTTTAPPSSSTSAPTGSTQISVVVDAATDPPYGLILTTSGGMPLYTLSGTCTGSCASAWPALTVPAGTKPSGGAGVTGSIGTAKEANGDIQVTYNGSALYTFVQDSPGHVTGQGVAGFTVVKASGSSAAATTTTTSARSGSGY